MGLDKTFILTFLVLTLGFIGLFLSVYGSKVKAGLSSVTMYNIGSCMVVGSIISCTISFFAICIALEKGTESNFYQQDVIVDILAILVTVLMGWNIISVVDIKRNAEKVNTISRDLEMVISGMMQLNFHSFDIRKEREAVIDSCFETLRNVHMCENEIVRHSAETEIIKLLEELRTTYGDEDRVKIYPDTRNKYIFNLQQISDVYTDNIVSMINNAEEIDGNARSRSLAYNYESIREGETDFIDA